MIEQLIEILRNKGKVCFSSENSFNKKFKKYEIKINPNDIHNQAQGIIVFAKLSAIDKSYMELSRNIASWTINNMRDKTGFFYYQKYPYLTNRVSYIRWAQAWMLYALSEVVLYED